MGCGASSISGADQNRDDLAPKPYHQSEVRKTSGFTRSNSAGIITETQSNSSPSTHQAERLNSNASTAIEQNVRNQSKRKKAFDLPVSPEMLSAMNRVKKEEAMSREQRELTNKERREMGKERMKGKGRYAGGMEWAFMGGAGGGGGIGA